MKPLTLIWLYEFHINTLKAPPGFTRSVQTSLHPFELFIVFLQATSQHFSLERERQSNSNTHQILAKLQIPPLPWDVHLYKHLVSFIWARHYHFTFSCHYNFRKEFIKLHFLSLDILSRLERYYTQLVNVSSNWKFGKYQGIISSIICQAIWERSQNQLKLAHTY